MTTPKPDVLRDRSAMKPRAPLWHAAETLADQMEQSRIPCDAARPAPQPTEAMIEAGCKAAGPFVSKMSIEGIYLAMTAARPTVSGQKENNNAT